MKKKKRKFKKRYLKKKVRKVSLKKKNKNILKKRKKNKAKKSKAKKRLKSKKTTRTVILSLLKANEKLKSVFRFNFNLDRSLQNFFQGISNKISDSFCKLSKLQDDPSITKEEVLELTKISENSNVKVLVNNAAITCPGKKLDELSTEEIHTMLTINLIAPILLTKFLENCLSDIIKPSLGFK